MEDKQLVAAARRAGIVDSFINMTDDVETVSDDTRAALLAAMGRDPADVPEITPVPPVKVFTQGKKVLLTPEGAGAFQLATDAGKRQSDAWRHPGGSGAEPRRSAACRLSPADVIAKRQCLALPDYRRAAALL